VRSINWLFWFLLTALVFTGCAPPIGYITGGNGAAGDELLVVPYRIVYDLYSLFRRRNDVAVFVSYNGLVRSISVDNVTISIIENPSKPDTLIEISNDEDYMLEHSGRKIIVIHYNGLEVRYSIEVQNPLGLEENTDEGNVGMGSGGITWEYPGRNR
jgi:hypothetical protein